MPGPKVNKWVKPSFTVDTKTACYGDIAPSQLDSSTKESCLLYTDPAVITQELDRLFQQLWINVMNNANLTDELAKTTNFCFDANVCDLKLPQCARNRQLIAVRIAVARLKIIAININNSIYQRLTGGAYQSASARNDPQDIKKEIEAEYDLQPLEQEITAIHQKLCDGLIPRLSKKKECFAA